MRKRRESKNRGSAASDDLRPRPPVESRGGFKPGPWPSGGPPDVEDHPMPGHIPAGWPFGKEVGKLTHPKE